jgi:hypothetical protein
MINAVNSAKALSGCIFDRWGAASSKELVWSEYEMSGLVISNI